jgi:hypothetical protein
MRDSRALKLTPEGREGLADVFGVKLGDEARPAKSKEVASRLRI